MFTFGTRSKKVLSELHPDLIDVMTHALSKGEIDFALIEGVRSIERQKKMVRQGRSMTMRSRHLPGPDGLSRAVDVAPYIDGGIVWDWPYFYKLADVIKSSASELGIPIEWGGDWRTFQDGPHWQLPWEEYPI